MADRRKRAVLVGVALLVIVGVLAFVGVQIGSEWATFIPDLIIGVAGASGIGLALFALQQSSERRRNVDADVSAAYARLLDALTPLRILDMQSGDVQLLSITATRMGQLYEAIAPNDPALGRWFEAERQLCMNRAVLASEASKALPSGATLDELFNAAAPFHNWVAEFTGNVRFWRGGKLAAAQMTKQADTIEQGLRAVGAWRDGPSWRQYL